MSLRVKRFFEHAHDFMKPGLFYERIPYDYAGTDRAVIEQFEKWNVPQSRRKIISVTGPLGRDIPAMNGHCGGWGMEMIVLYEDAP